MDDGQSHLTKAITSELEKFTQQISTDVAERVKAKKKLNNILEALRENNYDLVGQHLSKGINPLIETYPQVQQTLQNLKFDVNRHQEEQLRLTYIQIEEYCRNMKIPFNGSASTKYVIDHYIEVEVDRKKHRTKVGNLSISSLQWPRVLEALEAERARLWKRELDILQFRDQLVHAYQELEGSGRPSTAWASLDEIYQTLKREKEKRDQNWKKGGRLIAYYKDEFSVDISLLWRAQSQKEIDKPHIELSSIRDPRKQYSILQPDKTIGSFGFLRFLGG